MSPDPDRFDPRSRRPGVRRTALIVAAVALAVYVFVIVRTGMA